MTYREWLNENFGSLRRKEVPPVADPKTNADLIMDRVMNIIEKGEPEDSLKAIALMSSMGATDMNAEVAAAVRAAKHVAAIAKADAEEGRSPGAGSCGDYCSGGCQKTIPVEQNFECTAECCDPELDHLSAARDHVAKQNFGDAMSSILDYLEDEELDACCEENACCAPAEDPETAELRDILHDAIDECVDRNGDINVTTETGGLGHLYDGTPIGIKHRLTLEWSV